MHLKQYNFRHGLCYFLKRVFRVCVCVFAAFVIPDWKQSFTRDAIAPELTIICLAGGVHNYVSSEHVFISEVWLFAGMFGTQTSLQTPLWRHRYTTFTHILQNKRKDTWLPPAQTEIFKSCPVSTLVFCLQLLVYYSRHARTHNILLCQVRTQDNTQTNNDKTIECLTRWRFG